MNLQEAQRLIRHLIKYEEYVNNWVRPTSITLIEDRYDEIAKLSNPFNMTTIAWLEKTCNITIVRKSEVKSLNYLDILDRL